MKQNICISDYDYPLPEERIAKFPLERREQSKLLLCRDGRVSEDRFFEVGKYLPEGSLLVFNNTKVIRARLVFYKETGARIEIFCLEPHDPADYERAFAAKRSSVAAPTAGLHFTPELIESLRRAGHPTDEVTLHVGAGTFLPVKTDRVIDHRMHTEHFEFSVSTIRNLIAYDGRVTAVGTTSVRTLESLAALGYRIVRDGEPDPERVVGQWEIYDIPDGLDGRELLAALADYMERERLQKIKTSTRIMIMPGYRFRVVNSLLTNFPQPKSTLLLLVSAFIGEDWRRAYRYALDNGFRFLSYGDSSLLIR